MTKQFFIGVKAVIVNQDKKILLIKRSKKYKDCIGEVWDIPGGRIDFGEEPGEGLKREVKEETGLELKEIKKILDASTVYKDDEKQIVRLTFLCSIYEDMPTLSEEHKEFIWTEPGKIDFEFKDKLLEKVIKKISSSS